VANDPSRPSHRNPSIMAEGGPPARAAFPALAAGGLRTVGDLRAALRQETAAGGPRGDLRALCTLLPPSWRPLVSATDFHL